MCSQSRVNMGTNGSWESNFDNASPVAEGRSAWHILGSYAIMFLWVKNYYNQADYGDFLELPNHF